VKSSRTGFLIRAIELDIPMEGASVTDGPETVFAEHFYAELGGNEGQPVGCVSAADQDAARSLVSKLPHIFLSQPEKAGRELARFVSRSTERTKFPIRSLPLAVRTFGDEFLTGIVQRAEREARERLAARKAEHHQRFEPIYRAELRSMAELLESTGGESWEACVAWFKAKSERRRSMSETYYRRAMQQWDDPDGRCEIIIEYLSETQPESVPSFWEWDATKNESPFSTEGTHP
jgi:hypothetical protein